MKQCVFVSRTESATGEWWASAAVVGPEMWGKVWFPSKSPKWYSPVSIASSHGLTQGATLGGKLCCQAQKCASSVPVTGAY